MPALWGLLLLAPWAGAQDTAPASRPGSEPAPDVLFLHMNDFHGQFRPQEAVWRARSAGDGPLPLVGGAAALSGYVQRARAEAAASGTRVILTDAGDWYQGTIEGNETKGRLAIEFLSRLAPDVAEIGNHEYDFGADNLRELVKAARFPVLGANILVAGARGRTLVDYARAWHVVEAKGLKIVFVGLITEGTRLVSTGPWGDASFQDEQAALQAVMPEARKAGDVVVLVTHCGVETDRRLARAFPEVPLILGGHSHSGLERPVSEGRTKIVQTHGKASEIYRVEARVDRDAHRLDIGRTELVELDLGKHPEDSDTRAWIDERTKDLAETWDRPIGELMTSLVNDRGAHSTPAGNMVCDAFREAAGADLAFSNKGGLRTRLRKGPLTRRNLYELLPFDNKLVSMTLTGKQVRRLLESALERGRRMIEIGGGTYSYQVRDGTRVLVAATVSGEPLDDAREYRVATSSFLAQGGDGFTVFAEGKDVKDHGILLRDVLIRKVEKDKKLTADESQRILVVERGR